MSTEEQQSLSAQLERARERLEAHERDLQAVDAELEELATERQQYQLVHDVCGALEKLSEQGAANLFWSGRIAEGDGESHVRGVRARADEFQRRVGEIERGRQEISQRIELEQENCEILEDDLHEVWLREEQRKQEWVPEREAGPAPDRFMVMAWSRGGEEDERFWKSLAATLLLSLLLGVWLPMIDLPLREWEPSEVPERLTKLIQERPLPPPPAPVRQETKPEEQKLPEEAPLLAEESPTPPTPEQSPKPSAETKGILAFREKFSALADEKPAARLGAQARINRSGETATGRPERSMVASLTASDSGGINLAALSRDVGNGDGGQIEGVQIARATSSIGSDGTGSDRPLAGGPGVGRTDEEIQIVFDRHKSALYRLYNRELRRDPTLKGQMLLRLRIEPDGSVSLCTLQAMDMSAPALGEQVVARVKTFDFGAKKVPPVTILYPIDFLPAT